MRTNSDDFRAIRARFKALWPVSTPVVLDNHPNLPKSDKVWARLSIQPGFESPIGTEMVTDPDDSTREIVRRVYEQSGRIYLQVFVPAQTGTNEGWALAETFIEMFRDWTSPDGQLRSETPEFRLDDSEKDYILIFASIRYRSRH